jgi:gliding motility-associated-like protein
VNVVFNGNIARDSGGGLFNSADSSSTFYNTAFYNNTALQGLDIYNQSHLELFKPVGEVLDGIVYGSNNASDISESLLPNTSFVNLNGVDSNKIFINASNPLGVDRIWMTDDDGLHPVVGSPIVDVGELTRNNEINDIAENPRISGITIDIGAYELLQTPEISVSSSESGILMDGSTENLGHKEGGNTQTITYTITNSGIATLTLTGTASITNLINISGTPTVTSASASLSALGLTSLSPLDSTTFEVIYIPDCGDNFSFYVSITNNDEDENPFNFSVLGTTSDTNAPITPTLSTITVQCGTTIKAPTTTDNCSGIVTGTTVDSTVLSTQGTHTVFWTFSDSAGNSSTATQTIIIRDTTPPVAPILPEILSEETISLTPPTATDNCSGNVVGTTSSPLTYSDSGSYVVTWTFTDGVGNRSIALQKIRIERSSAGGGGTPPPSPEEDPCDKDTLAPVVPSILPINDSCRISLDIPTAEDNCSGTVTGVTTASLIYEQVGSYTVTWTFTDTAGNSSTAVQLITILYDQEVIDTQEACASFTWIDGVVYTESNNTATFETTDAQGCTSLHRLDLTINPLPDTTVTLDNNILSAVHTGAQYQWIDCENGNTPIAGATQQSFAPTGVKGSYAVQITTAEGCTLTSDCIPYFDTTTLLVAEGISPNGDGVNDTWVIQGIEFHPNAQIYVYNRSGEVVFSTLNGYNNDWRGDWNETGRTLPSAPYFYTLDRDADGKIDDHGWIYILN